MLPNYNKEHVYAVQRLVTAKPRDAHAERMRVYADDKLEVTGGLLKVFQQLEKQEEYHIWSTTAINRAASGNEFVVNVAWEALEKAKSTWKPVSRVFYDPPAVLHQELEALRVKSEQRRAFVHMYGLRLWSYVL